MGPYQRVHGRRTGTKAGECLMVVRGTNVTLKDRGPVQELVSLLAQVNVEK
jgi:hypothetical protein